MGKSKNPWRIAETWDQDLGTDCRSIDAEKEKTSFTDMAHFPGQSRQRLDLHRLLCGAHGHLFHSIRPDCSCAWDCLNHVIILGESHLRRILTRYFRYYHKYRTHLSLAKDAPESRAIQGLGLGDVIEIPEVGGLHHHYERRAA
jgi:hypothetical protein